MKHSMEITDEKAWLEKRKGYITSTESAALFGYGRWKTPFELWHEKRGNISTEVKPSDDKTFGKLMEEAIVKMACVKNPSWKVENFNKFIFDDEIKIGSSFDYIADIGDPERALIEIKTTNYARWKSDFLVGEHVPDQYMAQCHHEMTVGGFKKCILLVFVPETYTLKEFVIEYDEEIGNEIIAAVKQFWEMKEPPAPDFSRDRSVIAKTARPADKDKVIDATENHRVIELCSLIKMADEAIDREEKQLETAKAELMHILGDARYAWTSDFKITMTDVKPTLEKIVTAEMVGSKLSSARDGYKRVKVVEVEK